MDHVALRRPRVHDIEIQTNHPSLPLTLSSTRSKQTQSPFSQTLSLEFLFFAKHCHCIRSITHLQGDSFLSSFFRSFYIFLNCPFRRESQLPLSFFSLIFFGFNFFFLTLCLVGEKKNGKGKRERFKKRKLFCGV